jgi:dethiobiotin synthetase
MTARLFVTGTGTGVGKTVMTRAVAAAWCRRSLRVTALKPVETGVPFTDGLPAPADALALARAAGSAADVRELCRVALPDPVSPHLAAARAGVRIDLDDLETFVLERVAGADAVVVEGAGGLLVPLSDDALQVDFAARLGWPLLVVVPNVLGAINHALCPFSARSRTRRTTTRPWPSWPRRTSTWTRFWNGRGRAEARAQARTDTRASA